MIWYSSINEDSIAERYALGRWYGSTVTVVAGSGERVISLLDYTHIRRFVVVDCNPDAIALTRLKIEAIRHLTPTQYLKLWGYTDASTPERNELIARLRECVDIPQFSVADGLHSIGEFEQWLSRMRPIMGTWLGSVFREWVGSSMPAMLPTNFPYRRLHWYLFFLRFKTVYHLTGNHDPAFVGHGAEYDRLVQAIKTSYRNGTIVRNPIIHLINAGHFRFMPSQYLPHCLQLDVLTRIKERLSTLTIEYHTGDLTSTDLDAQLGWSGAGEPVFSSLSDLLSFLPYENVMSIVKRATSNPKSVVVMRSFLRNRIQSVVDGTDLSALDASGMYDVVAYPTI